MESAEEQKKNKYPPPNPVVKLKLNYKPMPELTQADRFLYHIPRVFRDSLNFNWEDKDYQILWEDRKWLKETNNMIQNGQLTIPGSYPG